MKIAVIGNCQCESFAAWTRHAVPGVEVTTVHAHFLYDPAFEQQVLTALDEAAIVLSQGVEWPREGRVRAAIIAAHPKTTMWPGFGFDGFHPDIVYLFDPAGGLIRSAMGDYNSRIIVAAFVANCSPEQTRRLFNRLSYGRLGYFDAFPKARAATTVLLREHGLDAERLLPGWLSPGPFMHTVNHPAMRVVADIARHTLAAAGVAVPPAVAATVDDPLAGCKWPVYPEIGERIGIPGDLLFVTGHHGSAGMSLEEMIAGSFAAYAALPPGTLDGHADIASVIARLQL
jgi:hypothetical protein